MVDRPAVSKGELEVVRALWGLGSATVRAVHESLQQQRDIDFATVQTYLRRLEAKGYVASKLDGRVRVYAAKTRPKTVIRETVDDIIDRLFAGQKMPLVRHLIEDGGMDSADIAELRQLVDQLEKEARDERK